MADIDRLRLAADGIRAGGVDPAGVDRAEPDAPRLRLGRHPHLMRFQDALDDLIELDTRNADGETGLFDRRGAT